MEINVDELINRVLKYRVKHNINQQNMAIKLGIGEVTLHKFMYKKTKNFTNMRIEQKMNELESED